MTFPGSDASCVASVPLHGDSGDGDAATQSHTSERSTTSSSPCVPSCAHSVAAAKQLATVRTSGCIERQARPKLSSHSEFSALLDAVTLTGDHVVGRARVLRFRHFFTITYASSPRQYILRIGPDTWNRRWTLEEPTFWSWLMENEKERERARARGDNIKRRTEAQEEERAASRSKEGGSEDEPTKEEEKGRGGGRRLREGERWLASTWDTFALTGCVHRHQ